MTRLWNAPEDFADELLDGFTASHARWVRKVHGGVTRSTVDSTAQVAVVIGGGSGHYPTFAGLVGPGLAHGAAMGNLFASPSAHQIESVARASRRGHGILMSFGNYAGDVLHFGSAADTLRAEGTDCRIVPVTDDIFSAPPAEKHRRRGIAGDLVVFKIAGAAAAEGADLDRVETLARSSNARIRSMGVAFTGCTLPGAAEPLFTVPEGRMAIGLGIHGEPGIDEVGIPSAAGLAELFIERLLAEAEIPEGVTVPGARVVPILNGLGSVKPEELFVVYRRIAQLLAERGIVAVDPQIGEFCTSFDMAGASLTLFWLDAELERLWLAPADTAAFRTSSTPVDTAIHLQDETMDEAQLPPATVESQALAIRVAEAVDAVRSVIDVHADELGRMDAVAGDGDHGIGMQRGARAAAEAARSTVRAGGGAGSTLSAAADAWADRAGGTSGALWGVILTTIAHGLGDREPFRADVFAHAVADTAAHVMNYGKAATGDKTMVDALVPFVTALIAGIDAGDSLSDAWTRAASAATVAAAATTDMLPRLGRARAHGTKSVGTPDPGAHSFALIVTALTPLMKEN